MFIHSLKKMLPQISILLKIRKPKLGKKKSNLELLMMNLKKKFFLICG